MAEDDSKDFVVGFLFSDDPDVFPFGPRVVLIHKRRPSWQDGKLNGVGGKIKKDETPLEAMKREFKEEAGVDVEGWRMFAKLDFSGGRVFFFTASCDEADTKIESKTDEQVQWFSVEDVKHLFVVPNMRWLIPMALDKDKVVGWISETVVH